MTGVCVGVCLYGGGVNWHVTEFSRLIKKLFPLIKYNHMFWALNFLNYMKVIHLSFEP
jgi:hypothetical protein